MTLYVTVLCMLDIPERQWREGCLDFFQMESMRYPCRCCSLLSRAIQPEPRPQRPLPAEAGMGEGRLAYMHGCRRVVDLPAVRRSEKTVALSSIARSALHWWYFASGCFTEWRRHRWPSYREVSYSCPPGGGLV